MLRGDSVGDPGNRMKLNVGNNSLFFQLHSSKREAESGVSGSVTIRSSVLPPVSFTINYRK